jgi:cell division protein FtsB
MKKKIKSTLSPLQRSRFVKIVVVLVFLAVSWLLLAPEMGLFSMHREHSRLEALQQQKSTLEQENAALRQEIERIESDIKYFEKIAREKHGLLKKNEMLFDFGDDNKKE